MVLTEEQLSARRVVKSVYFPLVVAELLEKKGTEYRISANKLINKLVIAGLNDDKILERAVKGKVSSHTPTPTPTEEPELTFSERSEP
jgi:hypothetical protein